MTDRLTGVLRLVREGGRNEVQLNGRPLVDFLDPMRHDGELVQLDVRVIDLDSDGELEAYELAAA